MLNNTPIDQLPMGRCTTLLHSLGKTSQQGFTQWIVHLPKQSLQGSVVGNEVKGISKA